jgi:hypothetical protein
MIASEVITVVRRMLNDEDAAAYRWPDLNLLQYLSDAQRTLVRFRPDLLLTAADAVASAVEVDDLSDVLIVGTDSRVILATLVCAQAFSEDSDDGGNLKRAQVCESSAYRMMGVVPMGVPSNAP